MDDEMMEGLFAAMNRQPINVGDMATLHTMWGDEPCRVEEISHDREGWPMVTVTALKSGDRITVNRARLT